MRTELRFWNPKTSREAGKFGVSMCMVGHLGTVRDIAHTYMDVEQLTKLRDDADTAIKELELMSNDKQDIIASDIL